MRNEMYANNVAFIEDKRTEMADALTKHPHRTHREDRMTRMDSLEFLAMAGGGVVLGLGIYLISFLG